MSISSIGIPEISTHLTGNLYTFDRKSLHISRSISCDSGRLRLPKSRKIN